MRLVTKNWLVVLIFTVGACMPVVETEDPCAMADRDIELSTLIQNSLEGNYESCLSQLREEATVETGG
jgi:hypothetical protein